jgi:hypothetical protein
MGKNYKKEKKMSFYLEINKNFEWGREKDINWLQATFLLVFSYNFFNDFSFVVLEVYFFIPGFLFFYNLITTVMGSFVVSVI